MTDLRETRQGSDPAVAVGRRTGLTDSLEMRFCSKTRCVERRERGGGRTRHSVRWVVTVGPGPYRALVQESPAPLPFRKHPLPECLLNSLTMCLRTFSVSVVLSFQSPSFLTY